MPKIEVSMTDEVELVVVGRITDNVKKLLFENFNSVRSKGFRRVNLRFFTEELPLRYLEGVRDLLLSNMVVSIKLYEYELNELPNALDQLVKQGKEIVLISDEEALITQATNLLKSLLSNNR